MAKIKNAFFFLFEKNGAPKKKSLNKKKKQKEGEKRAEKGAKEKGTQKKKGQTPFVKNRKKSALLST